MKVSEMVTKLQQCPQDWDVTLEVSSLWGCPTRIEPREDDHDRTVLITDSD